MKQLMIESSEKEALELLLQSALDILYQQKQCGIDSVSTDIEIGSLEEIHQCVHRLGCCG